MRNIYRILLSKYFVNSKNLGVNIRATFFTGKSGDFYKKKVPAFENEKKKTIKSESPLK